ncbi:MAG TPA: lipopolysaccharide heptosyltransferase II [Anaerohalosphaeraceae bacterium]|jgi:heptosyltransferase-2|nr:lipopolysaccharide heptosyltransferase II [Anaerohalosphaeraceae bacterium]HRT49131.1 lipopolysaccharide heptosyltransferase II [Anaerohalosphaeraceae bacterium]HRT85616.1 lipopolysaccharide heptosyltransferase II [Anaerohalosphaeraceae bacterium]
MTSTCRKIAVWLPSPMGDAILATPALRAIRDASGNATICYISNATVREVLTPCRFADTWIEYGKDSLVTLGRKLRSSKFDQAILFKNSFSAGLAAYASGAGERIGYARDGRSLLLTKRLEARRDSNGAFAPLSMVDYYLTLAREAGYSSQQRTLELAVDEEAVQSVSGKLPAVMGSDSPVVILVPGGSFGPSKFWPADRFAEAADRLVDKYGATVVVSVAPNPVEKAIAASICKAARNRLVNLAEYCLSLGELKALFAEAELVITNDTGPRHIAIALGRKVVSLFGPNDARWTQTGYSDEIQLIGRAECAPCEKPRCAKERHLCMEAITVEMVWAAAERLLQAGGR